MWLESLPGEVLTAAQQRGSVSSGLQASAAGRQQPAYSQDETFTSGYCHCATYTIWCTLHFSGCALGNPSRGRDVSAFLLDLHLGRLGAARLQPFANLPEKVSPSNQGR